LPPTSGDVTASLYESPISSQHSVEGLTSLKVAARRLSSVDFPIAIPGVTRVRSVCNIAPRTTSFCPGPDTQGIIEAAIQVMWSEDLAALKQADLDVVEAKIQEAP